MWATLSVKTEKDKSRASAKRPLGEQAQHGGVLAETLRMGIDRTRYANQHDGKFIPESFSRRYNELLAFMRLTGAAPLSAIRR